MLKNKSIILIAIVFIASISILISINGKQETITMNKTEKATFAAGCFWGIENSFRKLPGVVEATSGYIGGHKENPSYKEVCTGKTGHAEAVEVIFDPSIISYSELLNHFWDIHNPTTLNRQGPDIGTQYRSEIFYHNIEQKEIAEQSKKEMNEKKFSGRIVSDINPATTFWRAEEYHQRYYEKQGIESCGY